MSKSDKGGGPGSGESTDRVDGSGAGAGETPGVGSGLGPCAGAGEAPRVGSGLGPCSEAGEAPRVGSGLGPCSEAGEAPGVGAGAIDDEGPPAMNDQAWKSRLSAEQYRVTRCGGTEAPFSGRYYRTKTPGLYRCACCRAELFPSTSKFDSGTGWPSFWAPIREGAVAVHEDRGLGMVRLEVLCARCDAHLGHVFPDGPPPSGLRYCINSVALELEPDGTPQSP